MAKAQAKHTKKRLSRKMQQVIAWTILLITEIIAAAIPTSVIMAIIVSLANMHRCYSAFGSEWLIVLAIFCISYALIHNKICDKIFEDKKAQTEESA